MNVASNPATELAAFVAWCGEHIRGDEKGEAQQLLDRLFLAFGHAGLMEAGATCEDRVNKDGGGTAFADLVWKPVVLVEMKKCPRQSRRRSTRGPWFFRQGRPAATTVRPQSRRRRKSRRWRDGDFARLAAVLSRSDAAGKGGQPECD